MGQENASLDQKVTKLLSLLTHSTTYTQAEPYDTLTQLGTAVVPTLIERLSANDIDIRFWVAAILGDLGDQRAAEGLINLLGDVDDEVRSVAAEALGKIGATQALPALIRKLKDVDEESWVRSRAALALAHLGDKRAVEPLLYLFRTATPDSVKASAAEALGTLGDNRAVATLILQLENSDDIDLMWHSVRSLVTLRDPKCIEPFIKLIFSNPPAEHISIILTMIVPALGALGDERALGALEYLQQQIKAKEGDSFKSLNAMIAVAIKQIKEPIY